MAESASQELAEAQRSAASAREELAEAQRSAAAALKELEKEKKANSNCEKQVAALQKSPVVHTKAAAQQLGSGKPGTVIAGSGFGMVQRVDSFEFHKELLGNLPPRKENNRAGGLLLSHGGPRPTLVSSDAATERLVAARVRVERRRRGRRGRRG